MTVSRLVASACETAVISVLPAVNPVSNPVEEIVATDETDDDQLTAVLIPGSAPTLTVSCVLAPGSTATLRCTIDTVSGRAVTVIVAVARLVLSTVDSTVMVDCPTATAVTNPAALTVATLALLERQLTVCASPPSVITETVSGCVAPMKRPAVDGVTVTERILGATSPMLCLGVWYRPPRLQ